MRVLVLTAYYGSGHLMAARGLVDALEHLGLEFSLLDIVEEGGLTEKVSSKAYEELMRRGHSVWRVMYNTVSVLKVPPLQRVFEFQVRNFVNMVEDWSPDVVISTHFLTSLIGVIYSERAGKPTFTVITDFSVHPLWVWKGTKRYYVPIERTAEEDALRGSDVVVSGIPLRRGFWEPESKIEARRELDYPSDRTVVLVSAGSYSSVNVDKIILKLKELGAFVVLLAGRKKEAYERFSDLYESEGVEGVVYPFVDFVPKIMAASDIFVTKAGGVSIAEALAVGLPMVFINNMPGQEEGNAKIIEQEGAGVNARTLKNAVHVLEELLREKSRIKLMSERAKNLGKPKASLTILSDVLKEVA